MVKNVAYQSIARTSLRDRRAVPNGGGIVVRRSEGRARKLVWSRADQAE